MTQAAAGVAHVPARRLASTLRSPVRVESGHMHDTSWLEINLANVDHNFNIFRELINRSDRFAHNQPKLCAVVKADAYGLGAVQIAQRLVARGVDMLAVYSPLQAEALVRNSVKCPILLLMPLRQINRNDAIYRHAAAGLLHLSIHDPKQIEQINAFSQHLGLRMPLHLYFDTGMSRSGLNREEMTDLLALLPELKHVQLAGIYTHLASAGSDERFAREQIDTFDQFMQEHREMIPAEVLVHIVNTYGTLRDRGYHRDMVRIGMGMLGYGPDLLRSGNVLGEVEELKPVLRWVSRIIHVSRYPKNTTVGYDASYKLWRDSVLGVVPVGYGDGYPLALGNKGCVSVPQYRTGPDHRVANVLGKVNMDQIVIDLTDIAASLDDGQRRRTDDYNSLNVLMDVEVELISDDPTSPCSLPRVAQTAGTSCYEILCRLSANLPRHYISPQVQHITAGRNQPPIPR